MIAPFVAERALEQIKLDLGNQRLPATIVTTGGSYDYGTEGTTHHASGDIQALLSIPGIVILCSGPPRGGRHAAAGGAWVAGGELHAALSPTERRSNDVAPGRLEVLRRGEAATLIADSGRCSHRNARLTTGDLDFTILYCTTVAPFDAETLRAVAGEPPLVVTVEPFHSGTLAPLVTEALADRPARFVWIGVPTRGHPPLRDGRRIGCGDRYRCTPRPGGAGATVSRALALINRGLLDERRLPDFAAAMASARAISRACSSSTAGRRPGSWRATVACRPRNGCSTRRICP